MQALVADAWRTEGPAMAWHVGDLDWWFASPGPVGRDLPSRVRLWHFGPAIAGWAWAGDDALDFCLGPAHRDGVLFGRILDWFEKRPGAARVWPLDVDRASIAELERRGYRRTEQAFRRNRLELTAAPAPAVLPSGFRVRAFAGEPEIDARVDVHRAAFAPRG